MKFPTYEEMAKNVAEKVLDEYEYKGKTLREWVEIISAIPVTAIPATDTNVCTKLSTNLAEVGTDCISRQAVLNEFCHSCDGWSCNPNTCCKTEWIRKLPPIQPKLLQPWEVLAAQVVLPQPEIVRCKDCKYAEYIDDVKTLWCTECGQGRTVAPYDFCSYAERREVNHESN